jgi:hypothetical protein
MIYASSGPVELYNPQFEEVHACEDDFVKYIISREELRVIRNLMYIHIALLSTSVVYSNVTPYNHLGGSKTFYDIIEAVFFLLLRIILEYQLYRKGSMRRSTPYFTNPQTNESTEGNSSNYASVTLKNTIKRLESRRKSNEHIFFYMKFLTYTNLVIISI